MKVIGALVCTLSQFYFLCYFGDKLNGLSMQIGIKLFHSNWFYQSKRYKQKLMLLQERLKRPLDFQLCGFTKLNFETFLTVWISQITNFLNF